MPKSRFKYVKGTPSEGFTRRSPEMSFGKVVD